MRIYLLKSVSQAIGARFYSAAKNYKKVTHCIFDMDGLLLGELIFRPSYKSSMLLKRKVNAIMLLHN